MKIILKPCCGFFLHIPRSIKVKLFSYLTEINKVRTLNVKISVVCCINFQLWLLLHWIYFYKCANVRPIQWYNQVKFDLSHSLAKVLQTNLKLVAISCSALWAHHVLPYVPPLYRRVSVVTFHRVYTENNRATLCWKLVKRGSSKESWKLSIIYQQSIKLRVSVDYCYCFGYLLWFCLLLLFSCCYDGCYHYHTKFIGWHKLGIFHWNWQYQK